MTRRSLSAGLLLVLGACAPAMQGQDPAPAAGGVPPDLERFDTTAPDSVVLERQPCFGSCPVYRVSLDRTGRIRYGQLLEAFPVEAKRDSTTPHAILFLMREAERARIADLPTPIQGSALCAEMATDMPTADIRIHRGPQVTAISDYHGCMPRDPNDRARLEALRGFERMIDAVTGSYRWITPGRG